MDTITHHWDNSVFAKYPKIFDPLWWNPVYSWPNHYIDNNPKNKKKKWLFGLIDAQFTDAWHTFKSLMITIICSSIAFIINCYANPQWYSYIIIIIVYGGFWNIWFNLFYNHVLKWEK